MIFDIIFFITHRFEKIIHDTIFDLIIIDVDQIYVMIVRINKQHFEQLNEMHVNRRIRIDVALIENEKQFDIKNIISKILKKYENMNNENKTYELSTHNSNDHVIDLHVEKQFFHDFIYFLFETKLKIFKTYLNKHLINNFIR